MSRVNLIRKFKGFIRNDMIIMKRYKTRYKTRCKTNCITSWQVLCYIIVLCISVTITGKFLQSISSELQIRDALSKEIDHDKFRELRIEKKQFDRIQEQAHLLFKKNPNIKGPPYMDEIGYLTFAMLLADFDLIKGSPPDVKTFTREIGRVSQTNAFPELYRCYKAIFFDIMYFPVPLMGKDAQKVYYDDSWCAPRTYGGNRNHEGTDLMATNNIPGYYPIISITDGVVEKIGWLEQGGNRIGIRSESGGYFYYAHLDTYAPDLKKGDTVIAGQLLGFMGDSGYGKKGTKGQFDVHLHLGIYLNSDDQEISVNPYRILKMLEHRRTELAH